MNACPCCKNVTLPERGGYDICPVCFWEDDGWEEAGGANGISLDEAKANFAKFGAVGEEFKRHVRAPHADELPAGNQSRNAKP